MIVTVLLYVYDFQAGNSTQFIHPEWKEMDSNGVAYKYFSIFVICYF